MKRFVMAILVILLMMSVTACRGNEGNVHVKFSEKEITLFSEEEEEVTLKISVKEGEKEDSFKVEKTLKEGTTEVISLSDIAPSYFSQNAFISNVEVETQSISPAILIGCILEFIFVGIIAALISR